MSKIPDQIDGFVKEMSKISVQIICSVKEMNKIPVHMFGFVALCAGQSLDNSTSRSTISLRMSTFCNNAKESWHPGYWQLS